MSLKPLIKDQSIMIDDHKRGSMEIKDWDNPANDIHIDKRTKYKIDGKRQNVQIRIPINSDRDISVEIKGRKNDKVPKKLKKEIKNAFENENIRKEFVKDLLPILENFSSNLENKEKAKETLTKIAKHFDLNWETQEIVNTIDGILNEYTLIYQDKDDDMYYFTINRNHIKISNVDFWYRALYKIRRLR